MVIVGVKHLHDISCQILLLHRLLVVALVKGIELEALDRLRIPDAQCVHNAVAVAHDGEVKRNRLHGLIALLEEVISAIFIRAHIYITAKLDDLCVLGAAQLKRIAVLQPVVGNLHLIAVADLLLEHTVTVTDAAAVCRVAQSCKGIKEACRKTSQAAVTQCCVRLHVLDHIQIQSQLFKRFLHGLICL